MFPQSSAFHSPDNANDRIRSQLGHSASQSSLHASFSVGGVSSTTSTHHPHGTSSWASNSQSNTLSNSLNDPFLQSRSSYQSGYLMVCCLVVFGPRYSHFCPLSQCLRITCAEFVSLAQPSLTLDMHRLHLQVINGLMTCPSSRPRQS
jgi:hypothetical protein